MILSRVILREGGKELDYADVSLESLGAHLFFNEVTNESVRDAATFILKGNILRPASGELTVLINTMGGNCYDAFGLVDLMRASRVPIRTVGVGSIVSMGIFLLSAGHRGRRVILRNTEVMVHQFSDVVEGKFHELMAAAQAHQQLKRQFYQHFRECSTMTDKQIEDIMFGASDRWLTPSECKRYGLVDVIVDELPLIEVPKESPALPTAGVQRRRARRPAPPPYARLGRPLRK